MRGLNFDATMPDILAFFQGYDLKPEDVVIGIQIRGPFSGRPSGDAWVSFVLLKVSQQDRLCTGADWGP